MPTESSFVEPGPGTSRREGPFAGGCVKYGTTEEYALALQKCGATARLVQLQILDLGRPSRRKPKRLTREGEPPDYGLSQSLAGKPIINAG